MTKATYFVYCHTNKLNGKKYFGITRQIPKKRWDSGHGYRNNKYFWSSIKKNGWDNFEHEVLFEGLTISDAKKTEIRLISEYNTTNRELGYNITLGGESGNGLILSKESREKISIANRGHPTSKETRDKISKANKGKVGLRGRDSPNYGRKATEETRLKLSLSHSGKNHRLYGKSQPQEVKDKISVSCSVPVLQLDLLGRVLKEWSSLVKTKEDGFCDSKVSNCCKNKRLSHGGYIWMYKTEYDALTKEQLFQKCDNINKQINKYSKKPIVQLSKDGDFIKEWDSISSTSKYGFNKGTVANCCNGRQKSYKTYLWKYSSEYKQK